jgi:hypothetical protein
MGGAAQPRHTTNQTVFNETQAADWTFEGDGNTKVFACVPAPGAAAASR